MPNHSSPISMSKQSLKKIGQKLLKLESGNEALMDGRTFSFVCLHGQTDGQTLKWFGGYIIIPHHFFLARYKNDMCTQQRIRSAWPSLIRVFAVRIKNPWVFSYPLSTQQRLLLDCAQTQADPSLHWVHMPFGWFCRVTARLSFNYQQIPTLSVSRFLSHFYQRLILHITFQVFQKSHYSDQDYVVNQNSSYHLPHPLAILNMSPP